VSGKLSVKVNSINSNLVDYTIAVTPKITSIAPTSFAIGSTVTINGTNFGATRGTSNVSFNGINATTFTSWSNTKIVCKVPTGVTTGLLSVTVNAVTSNEVLFTIVTPIETVLIPAGTFKMGNTGPYSGIIMIQEVPVHNVTISRDFYMSKYEIIQELYLSLVGTNPSNLKRPDHPVERINWFDAVAFCNKLSDRDGYTKCYKINGSNVTCDWDANGWRLPTEAEWEYACKAGTSTDFYNGNNESDLDQIAWHSGNSGDSTHVPGLKKPNKFGLYDILGNVFEWVWD
jgi:formylglycine-generating enzyme required for sulfatase activity